MSCLAIITARGGSKRIPKKNIKEFMGKPMIAYAIEASLLSNLFDEVMVSTDDVEIAEIAKQYGAKVPFMRSKKNASDFATTYDVLMEVMDEYKKRGRKYNEICCIYPCVPFLTADTLKSAHELLSRYDAVIPVCRYPVPIEWAMNIKEGILKPIDRDAQNIRSQDLIPKYFDVGMFYFYNVDQRNSLLVKRTAAYIIDKKECQDIDTIEDWNMAEIKYKVLHNV